MYCVHVSQYFNLILNGEIPTFIELRSRVDVVRVSIRFLLIYFLSARTWRVQAETESELYVCVCVFVCVSAVISSSSSSPSSVEEGSSRTCVGAVPRDLPLYDIMSGIRCSSTVTQCAVLFSL